MRSATAMRRTALIRLLRLIVMVRNLNVNTAGTEESWPRMTEQYGESMPTTRAAGAPVSVTGKEPAIIIR